MTAVFTVITSLSLVFKAHKNQNGFLFKESTVEDEFPHHNRYYSDHSCVISYVALKGTFF